MAALLCALAAVRGVEPARLARADTSGLATASERASERASRWAKTEVATVIVAPKG